MKIIVSHDVDHLTVLEHKKDLIVQKYIIRCLFETMNGSIGLKDLQNRLHEIGSNKWQNISEIIRYDRDHRIPATFFIALNNAKGLSYPRNKAIEWIRAIQAQHFDVGIHGIHYNHFQDMKNEYQLFSEASGSNRFGIRMHYLRSTPNTRRWLEKIGYLFDSTEWNFRDCYPYKKMWEFPLHLMDVVEIFGSTRYQTKPLKSIIQETAKKIDTAFGRRFKFFSINFHDRYFSDASRCFKDWYCWLIDYLKDQKFEFCDFKHAIREMERQ
jgi:peptidoglycan/xylan/chitin deacetylase (PgdA/CDA1 family)